VEDSEAFQGEPLVYEDKGAVLHRLNREATNIKGKKVMLNVADFQKTEKQWPGTAIIFAKEHPVEFASKNLAKALDEVKGKLLGTVKGAQVIVEGSPRLVANFGELIQDEKFNKAYKAGKIEVSPRWIPSENGPIPDHILLFEGDDTHIPGDKGSMMFQKLKDMAEDPKSTFFEMFQMAKDFVSKEESQMADDIKDVQLKLDAANVALKQKEADAMAFQEKVKTLESEKAEKEKQLMAFQEKAEQEKKDIRWNAFQSKIPAGWKTADKIAATRKEFEESPHAFMDKLMGFQMGNPPPAATDGDPNAGASEPKPYDRNKGMGDWKYDEKTGKWGYQ